MKKLSIVLIACLALSHAPLHAQSTESDNTYRDEIELYAGTTSLVQGFVGFFVDIAKAFTGRQETVRYGNYGVGYAHEFLPWLSVTGKCLYEGYDNLIYTDKEKTELERKYLTSVVTLMPGVRFTYLNRKYVRLYSSVDLGATYMTDTDPKWIFAFNVTPIGVQAGNRVYGLAECNLGCDAIFKVGLGVKF
ncbi:MAG: hypothetical protein J6Y77_06710 [Paludibacteraceae bacterium]|nr:hypothetical protein [Paludibacteraceae bacterium]